MGRIPQMEVQSPENAIETWQELLDRLDSMRLSLKWSLTNEGKLPWYAKIIGSGKN